MIKVTTSPYKMGGKASLSGTVTIGGDPVAQARVLALHSGKVFFETFTDQFGGYSFNDITDLYDFDVIAYDPSGVWEAKISTKRRPGV